MSTILVISPEPWDGHFVSKHHYARELSRRGHRVLFHGPPVNSGPMRLVSVTDTPGELFVLHAPRVAPGLRFMPPILRRALEAYWLRQVERLAGARVDVVWNFENSRFFDLRFAGERLTIYQQVDLNQEFHPEVAARTADHVFCTTGWIKERLGAVRSDVRIVHHGVQSGPIDPSSEAGLFAPDKVNCVYAGNLSMQYLDRELILRCAETYPTAIFHFFGGFKTEDEFRNRLAAHPNVRLHGKVDTRRMLPILSNADILMVTYQKAHFRDQANPHKMMEYMMSGKVTVATYTGEYDRVGDLLVMCAPDADYVKLLGQVINDIEIWNTPELMNRRRAFAADNTYSRQLDRIAEALGPRGHLIS
ncbi:glycosyltransferase [Rhodobacterales bacterium HKCCSP123]|nr:glycosyltransferase [Rhodobacterales bacterium HKCCSP123]